MATNQIVVKTESDLSNWLNNVSKNLAQYSDNADSKFFKSALIAISENDKLMKVMANGNGQASVYNSLKYAASTGLSLNPQEGKCALIPYGDSIQYMIMKNGIIEMAMRSGKIEWLRSEIVKEKDEYEPPANPDDKVLFKPARKNRGGVDGYFAECKLTDGTVHFKYMTIEEVQEHANKYASNKSDHGPWKKSFDGMALKTVLKSLFRNIHISPEMNNAIGVDDKTESEIINITPGFSADEMTEKLDTEKKQSPAKKEAEKKTEPVKSGKTGDLGF